MGHGLGLAVKKRMVQSQKLGPIYTTFCLVRNKERFLLHKNLGNRKCSSLSQNRKFQQSNDFVRKRASLFLILLLSLRNYYSHHILYLNLHPKLGVTLSVSLSLPGSRCFPEINFPGILNALTCLSIFKFCNQPSVFCGISFLGLFFVLVGVESFGF